MAVRGGKTALMEDVRGGKMELMLDVRGGKGQGLAGGSSGPCGCA